jgi:hypothetical protein
MWNHTGVEGAWAKHNEISLLNRSQRRWCRPGALRGDPHAVNVTCACEFGLTSNGCAISRCADQFQGDRGSWNHLSANIQNAMHTFNATLEVSPLLVDRGGEQEISDGVPARCAWLSWESKAQKISRRRFRVREGDETVPQVAYRRNSELLAQHP